MRWSYFTKKECVDLLNGQKLGDFTDADLTFDPLTGKIQAILVPLKGSSFFRKNRKYVELSWQMIKTIGPEMVIVDSNSKQLSTI